MNYIHYHRRLPSRISNLRSRGKSFSDTLANELEKAYIALNLVMSDLKTERMAKRNALDLIERIASGEVIRNAVKSEMEKIRSGDSLS